MCNEICLGQRSEARKGKVELNFRWYFPQICIPLGSVQDCLQWPKQEEAKWNLSLRFEPLLWMAGADTSNQEQMFGWLGLGWSFPWQSRKPGVWCSQHAPLATLIAWIYVTGSLFGELHCLQNPPLCVQKRHGNRAQTRRTAHSHQH